MKTRFGFVKAIKEFGKWYIVTTNYIPTSFMKIGQGVIWATPYRTRALARAAIKDGSGIY